MNKKGIVSILNSAQISVGTGFFASPNSILTCRHVLIDAGYQKHGQYIYYKQVDEETLVCRAKWIKSDDSSDLAILYVDKDSENYIPVSDVAICNIFAECYGFPNGSSKVICAKVSVDQIADKEKRLQLGNANSITRGFSGAPVIYKNAVIGIINCITRPDSFGRMTEIAFAISSKCALHLFSNYLCRREICTGYGKRKGKCTNYAIPRLGGLCEECFSVQFKETVESVYISQNFELHQFETFFITELRYGISKYYDAIIPIVKFNEPITSSDLYPILDQVNECEFNITQLYIISDAEISQDAINIVKKEKIVIKSKEGLLNSLFDFKPYRDDLLKHVNSEQLSNHYIEVYSTSVVNGDAPKHNDNYDIDADAEDCDLYDDGGSVIFFEDSEKILLKDYINNFLCSKQKALLVLGDYGSGKTSFCYNYAFSLLENFICESPQQPNYFPILIKLRGYNRAVGIEQLLTDYFVNHLGISNYSTSLLKLLLRYIDVVLIFDGYDEVAKKVDFDIKYEVLRGICDLAENRTKIIMTCRPNYFQSMEDFKQVFDRSHFPFEPGEKPILKFVETSISELSPSQIKDYINSYHTELEQIGISSDQLLETIAVTHDLTDLSKRPFLLYMIVCTLPQILSDAKHKNSTKINAAMLYEVYTDTWIKREDKKNKTLIKKAEKELFCKEFAFKLYISNSESLSYLDFPDKIKEHFVDVTNKKEIDYLIHDIQSCSFLTSDRSGEFKFIHKSFMEYFVADRIITKLSNIIRTRNRKADTLKKTNAVLGAVYLSMEICLFLNDMLDTNSFNIQEAIELFKEINKNKAAKSKAKTNLLSILTKTRVNMAEILKCNKVDDIAHVDFSFSKFRNEQLHCIEFSYAHFYAAAFENITFYNCDFTGVVFDRVTFNNVSFFNCNFILSSWKGTTLTKCTWDKRCNCDSSTWQNSYIDGGLFSSCIFTCSKMIDMHIISSSFTDVDFSETEVCGTLKFEQNMIDNAIGVPYEF